MRTYASQHILTYVMQELMMMRNLLQVLYIHSLHLSMYHLVEVYMVKALLAKLWFL